MAYRGEDLDLRTLQSWTSQGRDLQDLFTTSPMTGSLRTRPIYVDDIVIACLNDAFELATAHRSGEVRLEHLLNAMTRVEAATKIMELTGVRVTALRRETGTIIASDLPVVYSNGKGTPRTGPDVEDVLRLAAERAYPRRQMVAVEDVLDVLAEANRELPAIQVLRRHWNGRSMVRDGQLGVGTPLPPLGRTFAADEPRERVRVQAAMGQSPSGAVRGAYAAEPARGDVQQVMTDQLQNTRIEALERLVRQLSDELVVDRKGMSAVFSDIQRDLGAARDDSARFRGGLSDRLKSMETAVSQGGAPGASPQMLDRLVAVERSLDAKFADLARSWTALGEKLQTLEYSVTEGRGPDGATAVDMKPVERQLGDIARTVAAVAERIGQLERTAQRQPPANEPLLERLGQVERAMQNGMGEGARNWVAMGERMKALEKSIATRPADAGVAQVIERFEGLERAVATATRNGAHAAPLSFAPVLERIMLLERTIEARNTDALRTVGQVGDRVRGLEEQFGAQRSAMADLGNRLNADMKAAVAAIGATQAQGERAQSGIVERVQGLLGGFDRSRGELVTAVAQPVSERMTQGLSRLEQLQGQSADAMRQMFGQLISQMSGRMSQLEGQITTLVARDEDMRTSADKDLIELHDALVKINTNQQTLATSLDQWRLDTAGDLSVINTRIEAVERNGELPARQMLALTTEVQSMHALQLKREARKSRFRMWLFGTEDWFGDSWERQTERTAAAITAPTAPEKPSAFKFLRR